MLRIDPIPPLKPSFGDLVPATGAMAAVSTQLAKIVAEDSHDYPSVQFRDDEAEPQIIWMYIYLVIKLFVVAGAEPSIRRRAIGGVEVEVGSIRDSVQLMRHVEAILQNELV